MRCSRTAVFLVTALFGVLPAQESAGKPADQPTSQAQDKPTWPKLKQPEADRVGQLLANFRLDNEALHKKSVDELIELGAGAAPLLIARLSDAKSNLNAWLTRALDGITSIEHAPLLAAETSHKTLARRLWSVSRLVDLGANEPSAYHKALADKDDEVAYRAAVGLASLGDASGMERVFARAARDWKTCRTWLEPALERGRGEGLSNFLVTKLASKEFDEKVTALRLFRSGGAKEHARKVAVELDSSDHMVKKEAINALRVVVLEQKPIEDLSVFQSIEMAKEIKNKL